MVVSRRQIRVGQEPVYDTRLIYSRVLGLQKVRDINLQVILNYAMKRLMSSLCSKWFSSPQYEFNISSSFVMPQMFLY